MKKTLAVALVLFMMVSLFSVIPIAADDEPIAIKTAEEFEAIKDAPEKSYYLANDIDFGGKVYNTYIIPKIAPFQGTLDGKGFALKNFSMSAENITSDLAVFQQIEGGTIKNLNIGSSDAPIKYTLVDPKDNSSYAILAGSTGNLVKSMEFMTFIENVHIYADMDVSYTNTATRISLAGFIAYARCYNFKDCSMNGSISVKNTVEGDATKWRNVGGFVASCKEAWAKGTFINCVNNANITHLDSATEGRVGGFIGYTDKGELEFKNCVNNGTLTLGMSGGLGNVGGLIGDDSAKTSVLIEECINNGDLVINSTAADNSSAYIGGMISRVGSPDCTIKNCSNKFLFNTESVPNAGEIMGGYKSDSVSPAKLEGNHIAAEFYVPETKPETKPETQPETKPETNPDAPATGDSATVMIILIAVMALSTVACTVVVRFGKEK